MGGGSSPEDRSVWTPVADRRNHRDRVVQVIPYGTEVPPIGLGAYVIWQCQAGA